MRAVSATELQHLLDELSLKHKVPGATAAVLDGGDLVDAAAGVINKDTGVEVTTDTLFQIGSVTKVFTTTLVMQLVDEGKVDLDKPVRTYLPELKFADPVATESITVRQLLSHTSGVDGDHLQDTGRGDNCVQEYVATCATLGQISAPGSVFSYSNVGFVVAGRLVEYITDLPWDKALKERLVGPLGLQHTVTLPEEAILHRAAVGHLDPANSGESTRAPVWMWPRSIGPAGGVVTTAADLLSFARMHLDGGLAPDGTPVLSKESVREMQEQQTDCPDKWTLGNAWGLGWSLFYWSGREVVGHFGAGIGQFAFLRLVPEEGFAAALLTNGVMGVSGQALHRDFFNSLLGSRLGIEVPDFPKGADDVREVDFDPYLYVGTYQGTNIRPQVLFEDDELHATIEWGGQAKDAYPPVTRERLRPIDNQHFLVHIPDWDEDVIFVFSDFDEGGRPRYLHLWGGAHPRAD